MSENLNPVQLPRRTALMLLASTASTVLLAACGPAAPAPSATASSSTASKPAVSVGTGNAAPPPAPATPRSGGTLRYGIAAEIVTLAFNQSNDFEVLQGMYDPLLMYDPN